MSFSTKSIIKKDSSIGDVGDKCKISDNEWESISWRSDLNKVFLLFICQLCPLTKKLLQ